MKISGNYFFALFFGLILSTPFGFSQDKHLFELDNPDYTKESNPERYQWEQEFIAFAKETEKKPENYIRHILKLIEINGESHELITYRGNYMWHFYTYYYDEFKKRTDTCMKNRKLKKHTCIVTLAVHLKILPGSGAYSVRFSLK